MRFKDFLRITLVWVLSIFRSRRFIFIPLFRRIVLFDISRFHVMLIKTVAYSDVFTLIDLFHKDQYSLRNKRAQTLINEKYKKISREGYTPLVVDLGANIGSFGVRYSLDFPQCNFIFVEPVEENIKVLSDNSKHLICEIKKGAIGYCTEKLSIVLSNNGYGHHLSSRGHEKSNTNLESVNALTLENILAGIKTQELFFLKIDIEGAEKDLFTREKRILSRFPFIVVEIHDWLFGEIKSHAVLKFAIETNYRIIIQDDLMFMVRNHD